MKGSYLNQKMGMRKQYKLHFNFITLNYSYVLRSQSFHSGVGGTNYNNVVLRNNSKQIQQDNMNRLTLTSTESSDYDDDVSQQNS